MFFRTIIVAMFLFSPTTAIGQDCPYLETDPELSKLRIGLLGSYLESFDPMIETSSAGRVILGNLHASLTDLTDGNVPGWTSEDAVVRVIDRTEVHGKEELTLQIRQGLFFRDGSELTTHDVSKTIELAFSLVGSVEGLEFEHIDSKLLRISVQDRFPVDFEQQLFTPPLGFVLRHDYVRPSSGDYNNYEAPSDGDQLAATLGRYRTDNGTLSRQYNLSCVWSDTPTFPEASFTFYNDLATLWSALQAKDLDVIGPFTSPTQVSAALDITMSQNSELSASVRKIARQYVLHPAPRKEAQPSQDEWATDRAVQEVARGLVISEQMQDFISPATGPLPSVVMGSSLPASSLRAVSSGEARDRASEALDFADPLDVEVVFWATDELSEALASAVVEQLKGTNVSARATGLDPQQFMELTRQPTQQSDSSLRYFVRTVGSESGSIEAILRRYADLASIGGAPATGTLGERAAGILAAGSVEASEFWDSANELSFGTTIPLVDLSVTVVHPRSLVVPVNPDGSLGPLHQFRLLEQ